jgi:hypothetical protein
MRLEGLRQHDQAREQQAAIQRKAARKSKPRSERAAKSKKT